MHPSTGGASQPACDLERRGSSKRTRSADHEAAEGVLVGAAILRGTGTSRPGANEPSRPGPNEQAFDPVCAAYGGDFGVTSHRTVGGMPVRKPLRMQIAAMGVLQYCPWVGACWLKLVEGQEAMPWYMLEEGVPEWNCAEKTGWLLRR